MRDWRTTIAGILLIIGGTATFAGMWLATGVLPSGQDWGALGAALTAGGGLIAAADGKSKEPSE